MSSYLSPLPPASLNATLSTSSASPFAAPIPQDEEEESIYNLIPPPSTQSFKPKMYRSKFPSNLPPSYSTFGAATAVGLPAANCAGDFTDAQTPHKFTKPHAVFGPKIPHKSDTQSFQRKQTNLGGTARTTISTDRKERSPSPTRRHTPMKAPLDTKHSPNRIQKTPSSSKNFIKSNALSVILSPTVSPPSNSVDYLKKAEYGQVPSYLNSVKSEITQERDYIDALIQQRAQDRAAATMVKTQVLSDDDRKSLLESLQITWKEKNRLYLLQSHNVGLDSQAKIRRKETLEKELNDIEKAIEKLSKTHVIIQ